MPELPEVQTLVDDLNKESLVGTSIAAVRVFWPRTIAAATPDLFCAEVTGCKIERIWRRAKFIIFDLNKGYDMAVHLRMTGRFQFSEPSRIDSKHVHVVLELNDGRCLQFHDTRKFGRFFLVADMTRFLGRLGPEPLDRRFSARYLMEKLKTRNRQIKPLLLDQSFLAGLGNIYVDEALWRARIHPETPSGCLTEAQGYALHRAIRKSLRAGLRNAGTTLGSGKGNFSSIRQTYGRNAVELNVFRRTGSPCPRCRAPIQRIIVGQRGTHICPQCQVDLTA